MWAGHACLQTMNTDWHLSQTHAVPITKMAPARLLVMLGEKHLAMMVTSSCCPNVLARHTAVERPITPAPTTAARGRDRG